MLHSTILSHVFMVVFLYMCTVAALTDRELEKIINTAVSGEELKDFRRYPDLEDLGEFKTNLDGLENLSDEGPEDFGSVETENVDDGMYDAVMRDKRAVEMENLVKNEFEHSAGVNKDNTNYNNFRSKSLIKRDLFHVTEEGSPKEAKATGIENHNTVRNRVVVPNQTLSRRYEARKVKRSVRQNEDKANSILDKVRQCLLDESCLKRHVDKLISKDASKENFRIQTRNVFCNRRGCGRRKRSSSGQGQAQGNNRDMIYNGQVLKRNFMCNRSGCRTKTKRHALENNDFYETLPKRHMSVSDGLELISLLDILKQDPVIAGEESTPDSTFSKLRDRSDGQLYDLSDRTASSSSLLDSLSGKEDYQFRRIPFKLCGTNNTCGKRFSRLIAQGLYEIE